MEFAFKHRAADIFSQAVADVLMPAEDQTPSQWAEAQLVVPDGPFAGQSFSLSLTEYLRQPLDLLGPDLPVNEIAVMKSAQTGFTTMLIAIVGFMIDRAPCHVLLVQPTPDALSDFNRLKLDPAIKATPVLRRKVATQTSRSSAGSTMHNKAFPGGSIALAIASSAADLRSKTVRVLLRDEIDQYPDDLDGQGSPLEISDGRLMAFLNQGVGKRSMSRPRRSRARLRLNGASTPGTSVAGESRAQAAAQNSPSSSLAFAIQKPFRTRRIMLRPAVGRS
jgi:phage terminase large subunit GpA-like protein